MQHSVVFTQLYNQQHGLLPTSMLSSQITGARVHSTRVKHRVSLASYNPQQAITIVVY